MSRKAKPKLLACRFCGDTTDARDGMHVSHWSHTHPAVCPYRQDRVPALNGVHVGDLWRNLHTGNVVRVLELRLGGAGTYTDREPVAVTVGVWDKPDENELPVKPTLDELAQMEPADDGWLHEHPLWSLVEHWEPLTRPGDFPVPWEPSKRWEGDRSVPDAWRCPGYRGGSAELDEDRDKKYWHAFHTVKGHGIEWERTNVLWQIDPDAEPTLLTPAAPEPIRSDPERPGATGFQMEAHSSTGGKWERMQDGKAGKVWKPRATAAEAIAKCCEWTGWLFIPAMQVRDLATGEVVWRGVGEHDTEAGPSVPHPDEPPWGAAEPEPTPEQPALF